MEDAEGIAFQDDDFFAPVAVRWGARNAVAATIRLERCFLVLVEGFQTGSLVGFGVWARRLSPGDG
jgi:hypothetical protein